MRFRFKIKSLFILTTLIGIVAAYYLSVSAGAKEEQRVLDEIRRQGIYVSEHYEPIVADGSWRSVGQTISWPWHAITGTEIPHCLGLRLDLTNVPLQKTGLPEEFTPNLRACTNLKRLTWAGPMNAKQIASLNTLPRLCEIQLAEATLEDDIVDALLESEQWKSLRFGKHQLSVQSFESLVDAGVQVEQHGLSDLTRENNFLEYDGISYLSNIDKTELTVVLAAPETDIGTQATYYEFQYCLSLESRPDRYTRDIETVRLTCQLDGLNCKLGELVGREKSLSPKPSFEKNLYYIVNHLTNRNITELSCKIVSRQANEFRIEGVFKLGDTKEAKLDAFFPVRKITVSLREEDAAEDASRILTEAGLDPDDFEEPTYNPRYRKLEFRFKQ